MITLCVHLSFSRFAVASPAPTCVHFYFSFPLDLSMVIKTCFGYFISLLYFKTEEKEKFLKKKTISEGSSKLEHTPMHSGGGRIVGGTDASRGRLLSEEGCHH